MLTPASAAEAGHVADGIGFPLESRCDMQALFGQSNAWKVSELSWDVFQQFSRTQPFRMEVPMRQTLDHWQVTLLGSLSGRVVLVGSQRHGQWIRTSPVLEVRLVGANRQPMAVTESGTSYLLGELAAGFSLDDAEQWVHDKMRTATAPEALVLPGASGPRDAFGLQRPL